MRLPCDLTLVDLQASFRHVAHALLTLFTAVHGEIVNVWGLIRHLKVSDAAVTLLNDIQRVKKQQNFKTLHWIKSSYFVI